MQKTALAAHARLGFSKGGSLIGELGRVVYAPENGSADEESTYFFGQALLRLFRGMHFITTFEFNSSEVGTTEQTVYRLAPGFMWFPVQRVEIRTEVYNTRTVSNALVTDDRWDWFTNLHLSF